MSEYIAKLQSLTLEQIGKELFSVAKKNQEHEQWKINCICAELIRRDKEVKELRIAASWANYD